MADADGQNANLPTIGAMFHEWVNTYVSPGDRGTFDYCDIASLSRERTKGCVRWTLVKVMASSGGLLIQIGANATLPIVVFSTTHLVEVKVGV